MIKFTPLVNDPVITGRFGEGAFAYSDGEDGLIAFKINESFVNLITVECADGIVIEGLVRSALNFAANRGAYTARAAAGIDDTAVFVLKKLGFEEEDGLLTADIPDVLTCGCKGCSQ